MKMYSKIIEDMNPLILILTLMVLSFAYTISAEEELDKDVETVTIVGNKSDVAGAASVISNEDLQKVMDTDIHKILSAVPGLYFRTEDGYGLRPNISIRGTSIDRSAKVTIMEDGILVAPAPYTSASAYYFPTTARINSVEVLKGPSAISEGPSTIGGAINLISTPIPEVNSGRFVQEIGENGMTRTHVYAGMNSGNLGALVEIHEHQSDGFDSIANVGGDTGFDKSDIMFKARYDSGDHSLTLKLVEIDESSDQTYVGLSQASFESNPRMRYGLTQYDVMNNDGDQMSLTYAGSIGNFDVVASKWSNDYPANRLGLAQWLVSDSHPLTARVFVNRVWQMLFGQGLVKTAEDFGVQGASPTHLELLDWLAVDFIKSGWDVKRLVKSIVTSATYRQQSDVSPEILEWDPENKWLARGPQKRLPAHFVRDQLLELSGLKVDLIGGPPVFPYQPDDLWGEVSRKTYPESKGAGRYRRSLYTYFKRTVAPPLMQTFDAADRESCIVRQQTTNTPLQALAMLNAPILLEAAWELAKAARESTSHTPESQVQSLFENVLLRTPTEREYALLSESFLGYQSMTGKEQESIMIELGKPRIKVSSDLFPGFCISLTLLGLDETLNSR